jgi:hypothetical protein
MKALSQCACLLVMMVAAFAQDNAGAPATSHSSPTSSTGTKSDPSAKIFNPAIPLNSLSTTTVASELGGAFMSGSKCDEDGNLYIRKYATDRPLLGPVVKINAEGKRVALFDPASFSQAGIERADTFSPAADGGLYEIAQKGIVKPQIYVLHFSSDGSPLSSVQLDAGFELYTFAEFPSGNLLVSGVERDLANPKDHGQNFTAVFSSDGRMLAKLSFAEQRSQKQPTGSRPTNVARDDEAVAPVLDLSDAEVGVDGNLYVMRAASPALVYVISPGGKILRRLKIAAPTSTSRASAFHVSGNQIAVAFSNDESQMLVVTDAQRGRNISTYSFSGDASASFACYSANEAVFTFVNLGEGNTLEVIRAEAR